VVVTSDGLAPFACGVSVKPVYSHERTKLWKEKSVSMPVIPEKYVDVLQSNGLVHVATIGPRGEPQSTPVWFGWDGQHILFSLTKGRQKFHNLARDPRVALSITDPANPYRYLEVRGRVMRIDEDPDRVFINSMAKKYLGKEVYPWHRPGDERVVVVVEPEHTTKMG
jgi:PPOX class probable F420-dependent enzyme